MMAKPQAKKTSDSKVVGSRTVALAVAAVSPTLSSMPSSGPPKRDNKSFFAKLNVVVVIIIGGRGAKLCYILDRCFIIGG